MYYLFSCKVTQFSFLWLQRISNKTIYLSIYLRWNLFLVTLANLNLLMMMLLKLLGAVTSRFLRKLNKSKVISNKLFGKLAHTGPRLRPFCTGYLRFISLTFHFILFIFFNFVFIFIYLIRSLLNSSLPNHMIKLIIKIENIYNSRTRNLLETARLLFKVPNYNLDQYHIKRYSTA